MSSLTKKDLDVVQSASSVDLFFLFKCKVQVVHCLYVNIVYFSRSQTVVRVPPVIGGLPLVVQGEIYFFIIFFL